MLELAWFPAPQGGKKKVPGVHCSRMRQSNAHAHTVDIRRSFSPSPFSAPGNEAMLEPACSKSNLWLSTTNVFVLASGD